MIFQRLKHPRGTKKVERRFAWWPITDPLTGTSYWLEYVEVELQYNCWSSEGDTYWGIMKVTSVREKELIG